MIAAELPRTLADEIKRERLVDRLAGRWNHAVTVVAAPVGYGKSTALAQAIRDNASDPTGIDRYVRLRRRHGEPAKLAAAIVGTGDDLDPERALDAVVDLLADHAPTTICLHLDDVHEVVESPEALAMLADLVDQLPANARLVLAGRGVPPLPLGRLRAADQVLVIDGDELALTPDERVRLADQHGADAGSLERYDGWPAMTRLALAIGGSAPIDYLVEEIVDRLDEVDRTALAAAVLAGELDDDLAQRIGIGDGATPAAALGAFIDRVPLVWRLERGAVRAHDLWATVRDRLVGRDELVRIARVVVERLIERGRPTEAVDVGLSAALWADARSAVMAACAASDVHLSVVLVEDWIERFPASELDEPELLFLRGLLGRLRPGPGPGRGDDLVAAAMEEFHQRDQHEFEAFAAFEVGMRAWLANDVPRLLDVLGRAPRLVESGVHEMAAVVRLGDAGLAELQGDVAGAQRIASSIDLARVPLEFAELTLRHASTLSFLLGLGEEGTAHAQRLVERNPSPRNRFVLAKARFQCGDPSDVLAGWAERRTISVGHQRDDFLLAVFASMVDASLGLGPDARRVRGLAWDRSREQCFAALVEAAALLIDGDEPAAAAHLSECIARIGPGDALALGELRRFGPYAYVLLPEMRETLVADMGPMLRRRTSVAEALVAAREGMPLAHRRLPEPPEILTVLALPWSVELAARLAAEGDERGVALGSFLLDTLGAPALDRLRAAAARSDDVVAAGATMILTGTPVPPSEPTRLVLSGPLQIVHGDGAPVHPPRSRARQLLALLALRGRLRRDEIIEVLWPGLPAASARNNLRQTLNYARQLLDPERRPGEASFHLRQEGELVWLHPNPALIVDVWEIDDALRAASSAVREHRRRAAAAHLSVVAESWVDRAFIDLREFEECSAALHAFDRRTIDGVVTLAEWSLADDDRTAAIELAEQVLVHDPLDDRAYAVLVGAALVRGDLAAAGAAAERALAALDAVGLRPGSTLRMLLRRIEVRSEEATPLRPVGG